MAPAPLNAAAPARWDRSALARRHCMALRSLVERVAPRRSKPFPPCRSVGGEAATGERCLRGVISESQCALPLERMRAKEVRHG